MFGKKPDPKRTSRRLLCLVHSDLRNGKQQSYVNRHGTPLGELRDSKRELGRAQRDILREREELERQEVKLVNDIKKAAKNGQEATAKTLAKQLVRLRAQKDKLTAMHAQVGGVSVRATVRPACLPCATCGAGWKVMLVLQMLR